MGIKGYMTREKERIAQNEARQRIRIEDYGDDIAITIDGIKAASISGDVAKDIDTLNKLRQEFVNRRTRV